MNRSLAVFAALCLIAPAAEAAPAQKPVKPAPQKQAAQKPAAQKPVAQKLPAPKTIKQLPAGKAVSQEPPPGVRVQPQPAQAAAAPAAKPAASKPAPAKKASTDKPAKKKQTATKKERVRSGRAAAGASPADSIDKDQFAEDHLKGASAKSPLDLLASYKEVVRDGDLETAAVLLRLATQEEPSHRLVTEVHDLLGITLDTQDTQALLEISRASRAETMADTLAPKDAGAVSEAEARIHSAHAVAESAAQRSIDMLAIYKRAVTEENPEAAAMALQGLLKGPVDEAAAAKANALLALGETVPAGQIAGQTTP